MSRPDSVDEQQARVARVAERAGDLQAVPLVVTRALQSIDDPNSNIGRIAAILNTDQTIAGRLIGLANSALYSGSRRFVTVREAIIRLGFRTVRDLLFAAVVSGLARAPSRLYGLGPDRLWMHSLASAIAAQVVAEQAGIPDPERGYVAGLLHDVGRAVLDRALAAGEITAVRAAVHERKVSYQVAEREVLKVTHSEVGAYQLAKWGVGAELVVAVARHHDPQRDTLSALVHAADVVAVSALGLADNDPGWSYAIEPEILQALAPDVAGTAGEASWLQTLVEKTRAGLAEAAVLV